jgi:hypothetical protein
LTATARRPALHIDPDTIERLPISCYDEIAERCARHRLAVAA